MRFFLKRAAECLYFAIAPAAMLWVVIATTVMTGKLRGPVDIIQKGDLKVSDLQTWILSIGFIVFSIADIVIWCIPAAVGAMALVSLMGLLVALEFALWALVFGAADLCHMAYHALTRERTPDEQAALVNAVINKNDPNNQSVLSAIVRHFAVMKLKLYVSLKDVGQYLTKADVSVNQKAIAQKAIYQAYYNAYHGVMPTVLRTLKNMLFSPSKILSPKLAYNEAKQQLDKACPVKHRVATQLQRESYKTLRGLSNDSNEIGNLSQKSEHELSKVYVAKGIAVGNFNSQSFSIFMNTRQAEKFDTVKVLHHDKLVEQAHAQQLPVVDGI